MSKTLPDWLAAFFQSLWKLLLPPENGTVWDGAAWGLRLLMMCAHLSFAIPALLRPNIPLFLPTYSAFDDIFPFVFWGYAGVFCAALLWLIPSRSRWGLLSTGLSTFYLYASAITFEQGVGLVSASLVYAVMGLFGTTLIYRAFMALYDRHGLFQPKAQAADHEH